LRKGCCYLFRQLQGTRRGCTCTAPKRPWRAMRQNKTGGKQKHAFAALETGNVCLPGALPAGKLQLMDGCLPPRPRPTCGADGRAAGAPGPGYLIRQLGKCGVTPRFRVRAVPHKYGINTPYCVVYALTFISLAGSSPTCRPIVFNVVLPSDDGERTLKQSRNGAMATKSQF
jgi:hypothetical protein